MNKVLHGCVLVVSCVFPVKSMAQGKLVAMNVEQNIGTVYKLGAYWGLDSSFSYMGLGFYTGLRDFQDEDAERALGLEAAASYLMLVDATRLVDWEMVFNVGNAEYDIGGSSEANHFFTELVNSFLFKFGAKPSLLFGLGLGVRYGFLPESEVEYKGRTIQQLSFYPLLSFQGFLD